MPSSSVEAGPDGVTLAAFVLGVFLGGGNAVAIRFSNEGLPPFWGASLRFGLAALVLAALAFALRRPWPRGGALTGAALYGALGFGAAYALAYWALLFVAPGMAQILLALVPLVTLLAAVGHGVERFRARGLVGALLALAGVVVVFREQARLDVPVLALLAVLATAACFAEAAVVVKRFPRGDVFTFNAVAMATGAALLVGASLVAREPWGAPATRASWTALAYLVFVGSVAVFLLYLFVLGRWTASAASYTFVLLPFVTVALAAWLADERVTWSYAVGGALVLAGVYVGALRREPSAPEGAAVQSVD